MGKKAILILNNATGTVSVTLSGVPNTQTITGNITNGSISGATTIKYDGSATVTVKANNGYNLPSSVTVTNANQNYNSSTGNLGLSQCKGDVTITGLCKRKLTITNVTLSGEYKKE